MKKTSILISIILSSFLLTSCGGGSSGDSASTPNTPDTIAPTAPSNLTATASSGTVNLSWTGREGLVYRVHQATQIFNVDDYGTLAGYTSVDVAETSREITGLTNGVTYYFVVTALVGSKESGASNEVIGNPDFPIPSTPTSLEVRSASSGTVNLSWDSVAGASYKVYQSTTSIANDLSAYISYDVTETSTKITGLTNGVTYYFVVTALVGSKESGASNEVIGNPDFPIPSTPTNLIVTSASSGTVNLSWDSVAGASYKVYQSTASIANNLLGHLSYDVTETSTKITGLTNGTRYYFVVTALANGKESLASDEVNELPDFPIPPAPTSLTVTNASSGTVNLSWDGVAGATYKVYRSTASIANNLLGHLSYDVTETSTKITGLTNGTRYYFVVTALANGKESLASDEVNELPDFPIPPAPTSLTVTNASSGTVNLSWDGVAGVSYKVYRSTASIANDLSDLSGSIFRDATTNSIEITELTNGATYYFVVTALANGKESPASNEVIGLPEFPLPSTPTSLTVTSASSGTVNLSWMGSDGVHYYRVYQSTGSIGDDLSGHISYDVVETSTKIIGLTNNTSYYFVVTALANGKESPASNEVIGLPEFPLPSTPTSLTVTSASSGTVNLSWMGSDGVHYYKVYQSTGSIGDDLSGHISYDVVETSTKITGLTNNTSYSFVVTAVIGDKESGASNEVSGLPEFPIPLAPTSLTVTSESSGTVNLSWNSVAGASYKMYQSTATIGDDLSSYTSHNVSTSSIEISDLTNGVTYYFVVTALANGKESPASEWISGLPDFPIPPAPTSLTVTSESSGTVNLSWNSVAGASYTVYRSIGPIGDDLSTSQPYDTTRNSIEITGLTNNTSYYFVVTALVNGKVSPASNEVSGLPEFPLPSTPTNLTANASSGTVNLSWDSIAGASYKIHQATSSFEDVADYENLTGYTSYNVTANTKKITGLTNNMTYYFVVTAVIGDKESPASDEVSGLPEFPQPSTPTNLRATPSSGTVNLSWIGSAGVHYYEVYQSTGTIIAADLSSYSSYNVTITSTEIRGLANGTTYYFVVRAVIGDKESAISDEVSGLPEENLIAPPTNLMVTASSGAVTLNWTGREGATYTVHQAEGTFGIVAVADYTSLVGYSSAHVTETSTKITGLVNGDDYYFVVTALVGSKESGASNEVTGNPDFPIPSTPTNLEVTASSGTVNLSWDSVAGASYKVYQSTASIANDLSAYISYDVIETSREISGLTNGTLYYFVVTALENGKESPASDEVIGLPDFPTPASPTGLVVTSASSGTVNLNWNSVVGATYKVYQSTASIANDLSGSIFRDATTNSIEITGLRNGRSYYFVVTVLANGKESPVSNEVIGLPDFPRPATPTGLVVTSVSSGTVNLRWNSVAGVSHKVYQSTGSIGDDLSSYTSYNVSERSIEITDLTNGTTYYFVVTALANGKESLTSDEVDGLPDFPIPSTPTGLMVTGVSSGTVNLSWDSVVGATGYKVYQSSESIGDDLAAYISYDVTETSREISGLTNGTRYYFVVTALANGKESAVSNVVDELPDFPIPATPTNLTVTSVSSGTVNLRWNSVAGATSYKVHQSLSSFDGIADYEILSGYDSNIVTETSIEITDLTNGDRYHFVVTALANGKESATSNEVNEFPDFPIPATPTNLTVTSVSSGTVNLNWDSVAGATSYKVYQSTVTPFGDDLAGYTSYNVTLSSEVITDLTNNMNYYFVVTALANGKESPASNEANGLPEFPQPSTPTNLTVTPSSGTVNLSWLGSDETHYYKVYQSTGTIIADDLSSYTSYNVTASTIEIPGLMNFTPYYFVVTAVIADKESAVSNEVSGTPEEDLISPPTNLMVTNSSGAVTVNWTGREGATYTIHQATSSFFEVEDYTTLADYSSAHVAETSTKITGLMNGRSYYFVVTARLGSKESGISNEAIGLPDFPIPATPTNLIASASSGTVNLSWDSVTGASYKVYQSTGSITNDLSAYISYDVTETSTKITGLTNGTRYYFVVTALANGKESAASNEANGLPDFPIPSTPTNLRATPSSGTVNLSWTGSAGVHYYKVYQSTASIANDLSAYISYDVTETSTKITGLTNGTRYYFVVTAVIGDKESGASNEISGLPDFPIPSTPTNLRATPSSGTVNLSWTGSAGVHYYKVYQSTGSIGDDSLSSYQSYEANTNSRAITGLTNNTTYYFVVTALANGKESAASNEASGLPEFPLPSTPTELSVTPSSGTVNLSWTGSDGVHYYKVYQSTVTPVTPLSDDLSTYTSYKVTASLKEITGLTNGTSYYFVVTAVVGDKESGASNEVSGLPEENLIAPPTNLMVTDSSGAVTLNWTGREGATYKVHQATSSFVGVANYETLAGYTSDHVTATSKEITGLMNGASYYFVVTALIGDKESGASNQVIGNPDFPIPSAPTSLTVTSASSGTVNLSWDSVAGASYKVYQSTGSIANDLSSYTSYNVTATSTEITGLTNGTRYYFVVTALVNGKESLGSNEVIGLPDFPIPPAPTSLTVTSASSGTVSLSWDSVAGASYKVYQSTGSIANDLSSYTSYNVTATSTEITGLTNGTRYYFVVTALVNGKESQGSNEVIGLPDFPIPPPPTGLAVTSVGNGRVYLEWSVSSGAISYKINQSIESFGSISQLNYEILQGYQSTEINTISIKITGLTNDISYYFVVTALANGKESSASNEISETPFAPRPLNDTGITWAGNYPTGNQGGINCNPSGFVSGAEQDCHQGRDAKAVAGELPKIGGGQAGFDFTKLGSTGTVLSIQDAAWSSSGTESSGTKWSCVRDNVTGAIWEVKVNDIDSIHYTSNSYTYNNLAAFVDGTNEENNDMGLCGYNDWRVPTLIELESIMHIGHTNTKIDTNYFPNTEKLIFWSSTLKGGQRVTLHFGTAEDKDVYGSASYRVRLIRSSFSILNEWSNRRYTDHKDGTVTDNATGLMWAKCTLGQSGTGCGGSVHTMNWDVAMKRALDSTLAGYTDWRVPNRKEFRSLMDHNNLGGNQSANPAINRNIFPNTPGGKVNRRYFSSSPSLLSVANRNHTAWAFYSASAHAIGQVTRETHFVHSLSTTVRLVRDSQSQ